MINSQHSLNKYLLIINKGLWLDHEAITVTINYQLVTERGLVMGHQCQNIEKIDILLSIIDVFNIDIALSMSMCKY